MWPPQPDFTGNYFGRGKRERLRPPHTPGASFYNDDPYNPNIPARYYHKYRPTFPTNTREKNWSKEQPRNMNQSHNENDRSKMYVCPRCGECYHCRYWQNKFTGKIPLILQCRHTVCQECIYHSMSNNKIICPVCQFENVVPQAETPSSVTDLQNIFTPNYYIIGVVTFHRSSGYSNYRLDNIKFVSPTMKEHTNLPPPSERCCFGSCLKEATVYCPSCDGIYCNDCCTVMHKSTKKLMSHETIPRKQKHFSLTLNQCSSHKGMLVEFFCRDCDETACCYCVLDKHHSHERVALFFLSDKEKDEFRKLKLDAEKALKQVLLAQKKTTGLLNFSTGAVTKQIRSYFADFHGKLTFVEKLLCDQLSDFKTNNRGLQAIQSSLSTYADQLKQLVMLSENLSEQKLNLRGALEKLREVKHIPIYLVNDRGTSEPVKFVANSAITDQLDESFVIQTCADSEYKLVTEDELPPDYAMDCLNSTDNEIESTVNALLSKSNQSEASSDEMPKFEKKSYAMPSLRNSTMKHYKTDSQKRLDIDKITVQHINSMESFYIQYKGMQSRLNRLNKDIENYVKMGGAQIVRDPQLHNLYLVLYTADTGNRKERKWCRGRITDEKSSEADLRFEVFFIDYGKTQTVTTDRIKDIPPFLVQVRPLAHECKLHNPMNVQWNKNAHYNLAKLLNGKEVYMVVKSESAAVLEVDLMISSSDGGMTSVIDVLVHATSSTTHSNDDATSDGSMSIKKDGYYPRQKVFSNSKQFSKNQSEKIVLANVIDPHNVIVHLDGNRESFKSMARSIRKAYKQSKDSGIIPIEGTYVLVEYKDSIRSNWHRAFVKQVDLVADKVHVGLVDWGINVCVPAHYVKPLQETFTKMESQAIVVKMAQIAPLNKQAVWSSVSCNFLQAYYRSQDVLKMIVVETEPDIQVVLLDINGQVDLCLNTMMVENNLADSTGPLSRKLEWPRYTMEEPSCPEEDSFMTALLKKADEEESDSAEEDVAEVNRREVDVVKPVGPDLLWVRFLATREMEGELHKKLQIHYNDPQERVTKQKWKSNETCVVEVKEQYARGKILDAVPKGYRVYLYDRIEEIEVSTDMIFTYHKYFMKYPQMVTKSHLANIKPAGDTGKWSISSIETLQEVFNKHKKIFATKAEEVEPDLVRRSLPLDMWFGIYKPGGAIEPDRWKYVSINNLLIKLGFAFPKTSSKASSVKMATRKNSLLEVLTNSETGSTIDQSQTETSDLDSKTNNSQGNSNEKENNKVNSSKKKKKKGSQSKKQEKPSETIADNPEEIVKDQSVNEQELSWLTIIDSELNNSSCSEKEKEDKKTSASENEEEEKDENKSPYRKIKIIIDDWYPPFKLTKTDFQARVTCVETGGYLYLHEEAIDEVYNKLEANIKEYFDNNPPEHHNHNWEPGQLCTIRYEDKKWYRGRILKVNNPTKISVLMIDFGSDHEVSPDDLYREVLYTDINAFATKVKLDRVVAKSGTWLSSDYDNFHDLVTDWCRIVINGPLDVETPSVKVYNSSGVDVNQKLIELCPNLGYFANLDTDELEDDESIVIEKEEFFYENDQFLENDLESAVPVTVETISCDSMIDWKYDRKPLPVELLESGKHLMEIGDVLKYNEVYLKEQGEDVSEQFYDLVVDIQDCIDNLPRLKDIQVEVPCVAEFSEDNVWYRAKVADISKLEQNQVEVIFVDYGNREVVSVDNLRAIKIEWLAVPQQVWAAQVNITLTEEDKIEEVIAAMKKLSEEKTYVKLIKPSPLLVELYNNSDELCYQSLIDSGVVSITPSQV